MVAYGEEERRREKVEHDERLRDVLHDTGGNLVMSGEQGCLVWRDETYSRVSDLEGYVASWVEDKGFPEE
jgi:hypothetical protein